MGNTLRGSAKMLVRDETITNGKICGHLPHPQPPRYPVAPLFGWVSVIHEQKMHRSKYSESLHISTCRETRLVYDTELSPGNAHLALPGNAIPAIQDHPDCCVLAGEVFDGQLSGRESCTLAKGRVGCSPSVGRLCPHTITGPLRTRYYDFVW